MAINKVNIQMTGDDQDTSFTAFTNANDPTTTTLICGNFFFGIQSAWACSWAADIPEDSVINSASVGFVTPNNPSPGTGTCTASIFAPDREADILRRTPFYAETSVPFAGFRFRKFDQGLVIVRDDVSGVIDDRTGNPAAGFYACGRNVLAIAVAQKFDVASTATLGEIQWSARRVGTLTGVDFCVDVHGTAGAENDRVGTLLASSDFVDGQTIPTGATNTIFEFSGGDQISLVSGLSYYAVLRRADSAVDNSNYIDAQFESTFANAGGSAPLTFATEFSTSAYRTMADVRYAVQEDQLATAVSWVIPLQAAFTTLTTPSITGVVQNIVDDLGYFNGTLVTVGVGTVGQTGNRRVFARLAAFPTLGGRLSVNYDPASVIDTRAITLGQGDDHLVLNTELDASNQEFADSGVVWTVSSVTGGQFEISNSTVTTFTQAQVDAGDVFFQTDGTNNTPAAQASVSHPSNSVASRIYPITFVFTALPPSLDVNQLTLNQGDTVPITAAEMLATDSGQSDGDLLFTASAITGGQFERVSAPTIAITTWNQSEVTAGDIVFIDDGDLVAPSYDLSVTNNASLFDGPDAATITFTIVVTTTDVDLILAQQTNVTVAHAQQTAVSIEQILHTSVTVTRNAAGNITVVRTPLSGLTVTRRAATSVTMTFRG